MDQQPIELTPTPVTPELHTALRVVTAGVHDVLASCGYLSAATFVRIALENVIPLPSRTRYVRTPQLAQALEGLSEALHAFAKAVER